MVTYGSTVVPDDVINITSVEPSPPVRYGNMEHEDKVMILGVLIYTASITEERIILDDVAAISALRTLGYGEYELRPMLNECTMALYVGYMVAVNG